MFLSQLQLYRFRNYADLQLPFEGPLTLLVGGNAQGKSNLLEGICVAAVTRSPRTSAGQELIAFGATAARICLELRDQGRQEVLEARLHVEEGPRDRVVKEFRVNGHPVAARAALGHLRVVLFGPEDLQLLKGGSDERRRLLNGLLVQIDRRYAPQLSQYERLLDQRNALLRRVRDGAEAPSALEYWTHELAEAGAPVVRARWQHLRRVAPLVQQEYARLAEGAETLEVCYQAKRYAVSESMMGEAAGAAGAAALATSLARALNEAQAEEVARGITVVGPHRDDLRFTLGGREARLFASQGQQRSVVLSWKLAEVAYVAARTGSPPLLLLDDVLSELDGQRRVALLGLLERPGQTLVTACEASDLPVGWRQQVPRFRVRAGAVTRDA